MQQYVIYTVVNNMTYGGFLKLTVPKMDDLQWKILLKWMI